MLPSNKQYWELIFPQNMKFVKQWNVIFKIEMAAKLESYTHLKIISKGRWNFDYFR